MRPVRVYSPEQPYVCINPQQQNRALQRWIWSRIHQSHFITCSPRLFLSCVCPACHYPAHEDLSSLGCWHLAVLAEPCNAASVRGVLQRMPAGLRYHLPRPSGFMRQYSSCMHRSVKTQAVKQRSSKCTAARVARVAQHQRLLTYLIRHLVRPGLFLGICINRYRLRLHSCQLMQWPAPQRALYK